MSNKIKYGALAVGLIILLGAVMLLYVNKNFTKNRNDIVMPTNLQANEDQQTTEEIQKETNENIEIYGYCGTYQISEETDKCFLRNAETKENIFEISKSIWEGFDGASLGKKTEEGQYVIFSFGDAGLFAYTAYFFNFNDHSFEIAYEINSSENTFEQFKYASEKFGGPDMTEGARPEFFAVEPTDPLSDYKNELKMVFNKWAELKSVNFNYLQEMQDGTLSYKQEAWVDIENNKLKFMNIFEDPNLLTGYGSEEIVLMDGYRYYKSNDEMWTKVEVQELCKNYEDGPMIIQCNDYCRNEVTKYGTCLATNFENLLLVNASINKIEKTLKSIGGEQFTVYTITYEKNTISNSFLDNIVTTVKADWGWGIESAEIIVDGDDYVKSIKLNVEKDHYDGRKSYSIEFKSYDQELNIEAPI